MNVRWEYLKGYDCDQDELTAHGVAGWELVSVVAVPEGEDCETGRPASTLVYHFKRRAEVR